ncbi:MAG TPA: pitrilysin family protein [Thermoanaerobaculia bacterium]|nr:pitrilysin family protein [Thermoanaerobaculia bacterium]
MTSSAIADLPFSRHTLANGLRVVLHPDDSLPLVAINLWYHVGSKNERPGRTGFAHLFEHMLFQGSANLGTNDHFRYVQQVGGVANGSTWYDRTNYYETLPAHQLDLGLWLESDRMGFLLPAITAENLETQRQVVMNERRQRVENQPYGLAGERLRELLYPPEHPYHWPVIGYMDDIAAATLEEVRDFFRTYYAPNNAVLTLAGDFDPGAALERIDAWFGEIPAGPPVPALPALVGDPPPLPTSESRRRALLEDDVRLPRIYLACRTPALGHRLWYAADLLAVVLATGKSSRLYRDLVYERQIAQDVTAYVNPFEAIGDFMVVATVRPGVEPAVVEAALGEHLARAAAAPPSAEELAGARSRILTDYWSALELLSNRADSFSQFTTFFDDPGRLAGEVDRYRGIAAEELQELAAGFLGPEQRAVVTVVPKTSPAMVSVPLPGEPLDAPEPPSPPDAPQS